MTTDSLGALQSLIKALVEEGHARPARKTRAPRVVTISTAGGAGGKQLARLLGQRLSLPVFDKEILNAVAEEAKVDKRALERLDERVDVLKGEWLRYLVTGVSSLEETYRRNLINVVLAIASEGGVLLGRGGNFILAHLPVLRIRVVGGEDLCVARYAEQEGIGLEDARSAITVRDKGRRDFIRKLYGRDIDDPRGYDLVLNSDRLAIEQLAEVVELVLKGADRVEKTPGRIRS